MIEPGNDRSRSVNTAMPPGSSSAGPHHASSIRAVAAPTAIPARMPSPESVGAAMLHVALTGCGWYCWRMSSLRAKPPAASSTPRLAPMRSWRLPQQRTAEPAHPADVHLGQEPLDRPPGQAQAGHLAVVERQGGRARSDPQLLQPGSEPAPVEDPGLDTASPDAGAGLIRVVVRVPAGPDQTQARPLQERHQLRSGTQERLPTLR